MTDLTPLQLALATAIDIAGAAPARQATYTSSAKVSWQLIHELRDRLDAAGIDWRTIAAETAKRRAAAEAAQRAAAAERLHARTAELTAQIAADQADPEPTPSCQVKLQPGGTIRLAAPADA